MLKMRSFTHLREKRDLSYEEMEEAMQAIMSGKVAEDEIIEFLTYLREKGETIDEITAAAFVMREHSVKVEVKRPVIDTCGTGGDRLGTYNISTLTAFVVAGAGLAVAKHGNRSFSSRCGSADLLEALGVNVSHSPERVAQSIEEIGFGFMFAPLFHPAMRHVAQARKKMGGRTLFNLLGPLTNPAQPPFQLIGLFDESFVERIALALSRLGTEHAFVVHGAGGLDELSTIGPSLIIEVKGATTKRMTLNPSEYGIKVPNLKDLVGGGPSDNAKKALEVFDGQKGPLRDIVLLNAGCALFIAGRANSISEGISQAAESIDTGRAAEILKKVVTFSNKN